MATLLQLTPTNVPFQFTSEHKFKRVLQQEKFRNNHQTEFEAITKREREIITCVTEGLNNAEIAETLFISKHTVEQHRKNINRKLSIRSFSDLFQYALAFDLI